ncbi:Alpha/Beta hydrolase protein [Aspergillus egyptiacus]|nr:Alpha/Beta hydrolase protein [Aspergillus egyptiacus]
MPPSKPPKPYPPPLTIPPLSTQHTHTHTLTLLHGRGSNTPLFGEVFLSSTLLRQRLPTTNFIFPTARKRRSTVLNRAPINQWFDNYSLEDPNIRSEMQLDGLSESSAFLRGLVEEEARILSDLHDLGSDDGYSRVVVGGLSQGCAASVFCLLGGFGPGKGDHGATIQVEGRRLGGFVGMSGWLPFEREVSGVDDDDPFSHDTDSDGDDAPPHVQAVDHIREILDLPPLVSDSVGNVPENGAHLAHLKTPVFLGHGAADPKVSVDLGRRMADVLSDGFGMDVMWKEYKEFGHWYKVPDEIDDVVRFLSEKVGVPVEDVE